MRSSLLRRGPNASSEWLATIRTIPRARRAAVYPYQLPPLARVSRRFRDSALELGLHPFPIRSPSTSRGTTAVRRATRAGSATRMPVRSRPRNDADVAVIAPLREQGLEVRANTVVTGLVESKGRITEVVAWDRIAQTRMSFGARHVILAAARWPLRTCCSHRGSSGPTRLARPWVPISCGTRAPWSSVSATTAPDPEKVFHKQVAVFDYYRGDRTCLPRAHAGSAASSRSRRPRPC